VNATLAETWGACREQSPDTNNPGEKAIYIPYGGDEKLATLRRKVYGGDWC